MHGVHLGPNSTPRIGAPATPSAGRSRGRSTHDPAPGNSTKGAEERQAEHDRQRAEDAHQQQEMAAECLAEAAEGGEESRKPRDEQRRASQRAGPLALRRAGAADVGSVSPVT